MIIKLTCLVSALAACCLATPLASSPAWQNDASCGVKNPVQVVHPDDLSRNNIFIVGGRNSTPGENPWQAVLAFRYPSGFDHQAGATIIHKRWVLVSGFWATFNIYGNDQLVPKEKMQIWGGINDVTSDAERAKMQVRNIAKIIVYPGRNASTNGEGNLALIKLDKDFDFTDRLVKPICLPNADQNLDRLVGQKCTTSGWGETDANVPSFWDLKKSPVLQAVNVTIWSQASCQTNWSQYKTPVPVTKLTVCAGDYMKDTCSWDGGGPLACYSNGQQNELAQQNRWFLYGVGTGGLCATPNLPGLYARTTEFLNWITKTVAEN